MHAEGVQFYSPASTYPAIILLAHYFIDYYRAIFDTSAERSEANMLKVMECIKNLTFEAAPFEKISK